MGSIITFQGVTLIKLDETIGYITTSQEVMCEYTDKTYSNLINQWVILQPHKELCMNIPIKHKSLTKHRLCNTSFSPHNSRELHMDHLYR